MNGKIKFYNENKGYGFIQSETGNDIYFHISAITGLSSLLKDLTVEFGTEKTDKGNKAVNIILDNGSEMTKRADKPKFFEFNDQNVKLSNVWKFSYDEWYLIHINGEGEIDSKSKGKLPNTIGRYVDGADSSKKQQKNKTIIYNHFIDSFTSLESASRILRDLEELEWSIRPETLEILPRPQISIQTYQNKSILLYDNFNPDYTREKYKQLQSLLVS